MQQYIDTAVANEKRDNAAKGIVESAPAEEKKEAFDKKKAEELMKLMEERGSVLKWFQTGNKKLTQKDAKEQMEKYEKIVGKVNEESPII